jgi:hypothetical protein
MSGRALQPNQAVVVRMGNDGRDATVLEPFPTGWFGSPRARIKVVENKLVHLVIGSVGF